MFPLAALYKRSQIVKPFPMTYKSLFLYSFFGLAACSSSGTDVAPIAASGFANENTDFQAAYNFTISEPMRLLGDGEDLRLERIDGFSIEGTPGVGPIMLTIDGETYELERDPDRTWYRDLTVGDMRYVFTDTIVGYEYAFGGSLFVLTTIEEEGGTDFILNSGAFVSGYDTDPATVNVQTGTARFEGDISAALRNGYDDAFGRGDVIMNVDFNRAEISGLLQIEDNESENADFDFEPIVLILDRTSISGNGFTGTVSEGFADLDGELSNAGYEGRFFGPEAENVGGQFYGEIVPDNDRRSTFLEGNFVAAQE